MKEISKMKCIKMKYASNEESIVYVITISANQSREKRSLLKIYQKKCCTRKEIFHQIIYREAETFLVTCGSLAYFVNAYFVLEQAGETSSICMQMWAS